MTQSKKCSDRKATKTSQGTQSPITRLFKKLGRTSDSSFSSDERQNLLKEQKKKNKKQASVCNCKPPKPVSNVAQQIDTENCMPSKQDETFSCTSCALMKLITSDPPKLIFLFVIACIFLGIVAVLNWCSCRTYGVPSNSYKLLDDRRKRRSYGDSMDDAGKPWDASRLRLMSELSELLGPDAGESNVYDRNIDDLDNTSPDLSNILNPVKVNAVYSSNSLRDFYKKLLKTDVQIKNLRKGLANLKHNKINMDFNPLRMKRSLKISRNAARTQIEPFLHKPYLKNLNIYYLPSLAMREIQQNIDKDIKENSNIGAVTDSNLVTVKKKEQKMQRQQTTTRDTQIKVAKNLDPWWMDATTRNPQYEIKHSNNQNSEKLDDILDLLKRLDKQAPKTTHNMFESDLDSEEKKIFAIKIKNDPVDARKETTHINNRIKLKAASKLSTIPLKEKEDKVRYSSQDKSQVHLLTQTATVLKANDMTNVDNVPQQTEGNLPELSNEHSEYIATCATITTIGPAVNKFRKIPAYQRLFFPKQRRLLQHTVDENDEEEDDDHDTDYEEQTKEPWDREKRMVKPMELGLKKKPVTNPTFDLPEMNSPNWKGPMPLYHDELYMRKAALKMATGKPATTNDDNNKNNYDELVEMAQAYSDYGVLDGKKEAVENKKRLENTVKLIISKTNRGLFFGNYGLNNHVKMFSQDLIPETKSNNLDDLLRTPQMATKLLINKDNKAETVQGINDSKSLLKNNKPKMYLYHKRSLKSVETEDPNINAPVGNTIEPNNTVKPAGIENSNLKDTELVLTSTDDNNITNSSEINESNALDKIGNRTVVKRSANGNTIFWNDLYDDEYGVKDPLENEMKDKSSVKYNDLLAKSENWIGAKFKQIASNMKERKYHWRARRKQNLKDSGNKINVTKRAIDNPEYSHKNSSKQTKQTFEALTANMKRVLHEAAEAIQESTNREARSEHEQSTSLIQQLVGLMSELVDIQVRQKTCVQLPDDLRSFLAWLITPSPHEDESNEIYFHIDATSTIDPITKDFPDIDFDLAPSTARSDCLGTIHDIQDLINQYDEMSEEDKSKMSGVREYLQYQLKFLHKQLSSFNEYTFPVKYQEPSIRKRRQLVKSLNDKNPHKIKTRNLQKYFHRKRTKSTVHEEIEEVTRNYIIKNRKNGIGKVNNNFKNDRGVINKKGENEKTTLNIKSLHGNNMKRNLHDVYYSALAMAKTNATTIKYIGT